MLTHEQIARVAHEANRALRSILAEPGDNPAWEDAPETTRQSTTLGVKGALAGNTPEQSHQGWLDFKAAHGWTYGPVKDEAKREHPCFLPYDQLPPEQRVKDALYLAIVRALGAAQVPA